MNKVMCNFGLPVIALLVVVWTGSASAGEFSPGDSDLESVPASECTTSFGLRGADEPPRKAEGNGGPPKKPPAEPAPGQPAQPAQPREPLTPPPPPPPVQPEAPAPEMEPYVEPEPVYESTEITETEAAPGIAGCPVSFDLSYTLVTDFMWRGVNLSEYRNEGRERLNHQLRTNLGVDVAELFGRQAGEFGTFYFGTFFNWYGGQRGVDPIRGGQNFSRNDYYLSYSYEVKEIATTFSAGWNYYNYANNTDRNTHEWFVRADHNDAWMFKWLFPDNDKGILNPYFLFVHDVGSIGGIWGELGVHHDFELFDNFVLTPHLMLGIDHRYIQGLAETGRVGTTQVALQRLGLDATYNFAPVLQLPEWIGDVYITGFLYYQCALGDAQKSGAIDDQLWGGMNVGWSFGG
jgi:hypothetical protein